MHAVAKAYYVASRTLYCHCSRIKSMLLVGVALVTKLIVKIIHKRPVLNSSFCQSVHELGCYRITETIFELSTNIANDIAP